MTKKIKTKGAQIVSVPNTVEGQKFLSQFSQYCNFGYYTLKKQGRGGGCGQQTPLDKAKWIALYFYDKQAWNKQQEEFKKTKERRKLIFEAVKDVLKDNITYSDYIKVEPLIDEKVKYM